VAPKDFVGRQAGVQKQKKLLGPHERIGRVEKKALIACARAITLLICSIVGEKYTYVFKQKIAQILL
jgi:hypothetical protein